MIDAHRYRQALQYAHAAEEEIKRLRTELAEHQEALRALAMVTDAAIDELASANNRARMAEDILRMITHNPRGVVS